MAILLDDTESVIRDGDNWEIGEKVYSDYHGVVYIENIEVLGVHFGFRAEVSGSLIDGTEWVDSRTLSKEPDQWAVDRADELADN